MARRLKPPETGRMERPDIDREGMAALSAREQQVLGLAAEGFLDKQISSELGVSLNTLRTYWARIRSKVGEAPRSALAVAYTGQISHPAVLDASTEADWEIDMDRWVIRRLSEQIPPYESPLGVDVPFDEVLAIFHPQDEPRVRDMLHALDDNDVTEFTYTARTITPRGIGAASAVVKVVRDVDGRAVKLYGRRVPNLDLRAPAILDISFGYWQRDFRTNEFTGDAAFCEIFGVDPDDPDLITSVRQKFHPDEEAETRTFVSDAVAQGKTRARATHRLRTPDGSFRWATTDLRIEYDADGPIKALGTVMAFQ